MSARVCQGCGSELPPKAWTGRDRKWCSDQCRKTTTYVHHCLDCGTRLSSSDGNGPNAPKRCRVCGSRANGLQRKVWTREAIIQAICAWAVEHDGVTPTTFDWGHESKSHADYLATPERWPHYQTVLREFGVRGGWSTAMAGAGFTPRRRGERREGGCRREPSN